MFLAWMFGTGLGASASFWMLHEIGGWTLHLVAWAVILGVLIVRSDF